MTDLIERLALLSDTHRDALEWFNERKGQEIGWPEQTSTGLFLVNKAKGIHKPSGWLHALSVRQSIGSPYADRDIVFHADGSWEYDYYQEGPDPAKRDNDFTNRALMQNLDDGVPVAVLVQTKAKPNSRYKVCGLAVVEGWAGGYFRLRGFSNSGRLEPQSTKTSTDIIAEVLDTVPESLTDARKRINTAIVARQGSGPFRKKALRAFGGRCVITGFDVSEALEAAHIVPYLGPDTDKLSNTLLLRADLHTLFDRHLLAVDPYTLTVRLAPELLVSRYRDLEGAKVRLPTDDPRPWTAALLQRRQPLLEQP